MIHTHVKINTLSIANESKKNQKRNQKISWDQQKQKHKIPKLKECSKSRIRGNFIAINTYIKKEEKSQVNNLTCHLKKVEKEQNLMLKGRK